MRSLAYSANNTSFCFASARLPTISGIPFLFCRAQSVPCISFIMMVHIYNFFSPALGCWPEFGAKYIYHNLFAYFGGAA